MKKSKSFQKFKKSSFEPKKKGIFELKPKIDSTIQAIEMARISGQGVITYHFESENTFHDYSGDDNKTKFIINTTGSKKTWNVSQPLNKEIFFDERGNPQKAEKIKMLFIETAHDKGAKYFTI